MLGMFSEESVELSVAAVLPSLPPPSPPRSPSPSSEKPCVVAQTVAAVVAVDRFARAPVFLFRFAIVSEAETLGWCGGGST